MAYAMAYSSSGSGTDPPPRAAAHRSSVTEARAPMTTEQLTELFELMKGADSGELKLPDHDEGGARVPRG